MASNPPTGDERGERPEKRLCQVKTMVGESLYNALARLADEDDRALSDYVERVLWRHVFGHGVRRPT